MLCYSCRTACFGCVVLPLHILRVFVDFSQQQRGYQSGAPAGVLSEIIMESLEPVESWLSQTCRTEIHVVGVHPLP